jgi:hypothetical protein
MSQGRGPLREASPARPWATRVLCRPAVPVLCHWAASGFGPLAFELFFIFGVDSKPCKLQKYVQVWFEVRKI